jgi:hypothetical protein
MFRTRFYQLFLICFLCAFHTTQPMGKQEASDDEDAGAAAPQIVLRVIDEYYSDSEDEEGYEYRELPPLGIPENHGAECVALARGIHFLPSKFTRQDMSRMRRTNDAGEDIFSSAAYDLAGEPLGSAENKDTVLQKALETREIIKRMPENGRNRFQQLYSNQYDGFHRRLGTDEEGGIFQLFESEFNPQVSAAENFLHACRYASGLKSFGKGVESLDPEYDALGKPKHPYLGKVFVILVNKDHLEDMGSYFVVHGHANDDITVFTHWANDILVEREVSIPGLIEGEYVVLSAPIRVPSFEGEYQQWYQEKFGISQRLYNLRKKKLTTGVYDKQDSKYEGDLKTLLGKYVLPHAAEKLKQHIKDTCDERGIRLVYKQLDGTFGQSLPSIVNAKEYKQRIKQ